MSQDRRTFLKNLLPRSSQLNNIIVTDTPKIFTLGHLSVFSVHSETKVSLDGDDYLIRSLPEGLQMIRTKTAETIKLIIDTRGQVQACLNEVWPKQSVLSIFTGEIYNL